jgi:hypothetical protein
LLAAVWSLWFRYYVPYPQVSPALLLPFFLSRDRALAAVEKTAVNGASGANRSKPLSRDAESAVTML